jgi:hypothetical protein
MKNLLFAFLCILTVTRCTKIIDIDLNSADPQYVIEGEITNQMRNHQVRITKTLNFNENNHFPAVSNALVTISDDAGNMVALTEMAPGLYETPTMQGFPGRTYTLHIQHDGNTFISVSTMPNLVPLLNVRTEESIFGSEGPVSNSNKPYFAIPMYQDPAGVKNYYRYIQVINGAPDPDFLVRNDNFSDGKPSVEPVISSGADMFKGDTLDFQMQCIDGGAYNYFFSTSASTGNSETTPSNPVSNIEGGALGYFSACSLSAMRIVVE